MTNLKYLRLLLVVVHELRQAVAADQHHDGFMEMYKTPCIKWSTYNALNIFIILVTV